MVLVAGLVVSLGTVPVILSPLWGRLFASVGLRGLLAAWRQGSDVFAEVALPDEPGGFGLHHATMFRTRHRSVSRPVSGLNP